MNKLIATEDFESEDGKFKKGDELLVNDERQTVLMRLGKAERAADQTITVPAEKTDKRKGAASNADALGVPLRPQE